MKFKITRTSAMSYDESPHENAKLDKALNMWIFEINTLEELKDLIDKEHIKQKSIPSDIMSEGELVLGYNDRNKIYTLEFYDGWKE